MGLFKRFRRKPIEIRIKISLERCYKADKETFPLIEEDLSELLDKMKNLEKTHGKINVVIIVEES